MSTEEPPSRLGGSLRVWLWPILLVSYGLRVVLAFSGGQGFWPDESRYDSSRVAAGALVRHQWRPAVDELLGHADHMLFRWIGLPIALVEQATGPKPGLVAAYLSIFSVLAIGLIWAIARRAGAREPEALWAAFLAACANSLFYYSRHLFPYDASLCAMLAAFWVALGPWSPRNSLLVGAVAGIGFLTYNGYWLLGGVVLILHALLGEGGARRILARGACAGAGLVATLAAVVGAGLALGYHLIASFLMYAGNVTQGDFHLAYRVIPEYLWHAEGGLALLWLAALGYAGWRAIRDRRWGRLAWYAGGVALLAAILIFFSDVVAKFMVHGRLTRQMVPFLCLGAALGIGRFLERFGRVRGPVAAAIAAFAAVCAALNFSTPLRQTFPAGFHRLAAREVARQPAGHFGFYSMLFAESLWGKRLDDPPPPYPVLLRRAHPMQFRPYQYEGDSAAQRKDINTHDVSMRLLQLPASLDRAVETWDGYPGPVRLRLSFPVGAPLVAEPLVTSGRTGLGDFVFVRYNDAAHVSFGIDHWGVGAQISAPIALDYGRPHEIVLSAGCLLPPEGSEVYRRFPERAPWRHRLLVVLDGRIVLSVAQEFHPAPPAEITFGINLIGGSTAEAAFSGRVFAFEPASAQTVGKALADPAAPGGARWHP